MAVKSDVTHVLPFVATAISPHPHSIVRPPSYFLLRCVVTLTPTITAAVDASFELSASVLLTQRQFCDARGK